MLSPMACALGGVPASKRRGGGREVASVSVTCSIIWPPHMKGGKSSSGSRRPHGTPVPVGPSEDKEVKSDRHQNGDPVYYLVQNIGYTLSAKRAHPAWATLDFGEILLDAVDGHRHRV